MNWSSIDLKWLAFQAKYCLGRNWSAELCRDFRPWAIAVATVVGGLVLITIAAWIFKKLRAFFRMRRERKVADQETMNRYRWTGDDARLPAQKGSGKRDPSS